MALTSCLAIVFLACGGCGSGGGTNNSTPPQTYTVTFVAGTGGSLTGTTTQTVAAGGSYTAVTAVPSAGYTFVNWTGSGFNTITANPLTVTNVVSNLTITANFTTSEGRYLQEVFPTVSPTLDLTYGQSITYDGASQPLLLDLYEPSGDTIPQRPAIVWIHGGGFIGGDKSDVNLVTLATRFAMRGYVCVSINYRLRNYAQVQQDLPGTVQDAMEDGQAAVRWLRRYASTYRIDPARIVVGGSSAGGITSLSVAYQEGVGSSGNPGYSSQVGAEVDLWGALIDLNAMQAGDPPLLIVHGTLDTTVPYSNALDLVAQAQAVGVEYEFYPLAGEGHAPWDQMEAIIGWTAPFLKTKLGL